MGNISREDFNPVANYSLAASLQGNWRSFTNINDIETLHYLRLLIESTLVGRIDDGK